MTSGGSRISPRRGCQLPGGEPTYDFAKFSQKLNEIEKIWTPGGGGTRVKFYYVDPPLLTVVAAVHVLFLTVLQLLSHPKQAHIVVKLTSLCR